MKHSLNIIIPTLNRKDLLLESLATLDNQWQHFDKLLIIDNGNQNILSDIQHLEMYKFHKIEICIQKGNIGVGPSWNLGIDKFRDGDFVLILNDDVVIGKTRLQSLHANLLEKKPFWLSTGNHLYSVFVLSKECWMFFINQDGFVFDPKFYPAYFEDDDFEHRLVQVNPLMHIYSEECSPEIFRNSMTIEKDPSVNSNFNKNKQYYVKKWGGMPRLEKFKTPFNK